MIKIITETQVKVRYGETDQMGVVYHGNYSQYFEIARLMWLESLGFSYKKMESDGVMLPVVALSTQFKKPAVFDDVLTIITSLKSLPSVKIEFEYEIRNDKGILLTTGDTVLVFVSTITRKPIKCPDDMLKQIINYSSTMETP